MVVATITGAVINRTRRIEGSVRTTSRSVAGQVYRATREGGAPYEGDYVVTPTRERQELPTAGKSLALNVVVEAIPPEYGLVSYNGSSLRVS